MAWHGLPTPLWFCFPDFTGKGAPRNPREPEGRNEGGYEKEWSRLSVIGASAFLRGWAAGAPFTNPGELFAQCPPFVPRTFLKLFLALSSA